MSKPRRVLMLQGPRSPFFARLAEALAARGAEVVRVLFCPGDRLYHAARAGAPRAIWFRGPIERWRDEAAAIIDRVGAADVVGLGDGRRLHRDAFAAARASGARVHVVEQGLLRPGYLTLERNGLARWRWDGRTDAPEPPPPGPPGAGFARFAAMDVAYDLANIVAGPLATPRYRTHAPHHPLVEWAGWARRAAAAPWRERRRARVERTIAEAPGAVFLFALQLEADFMIRDHGCPDGLRGALGRALASFAACAPRDATLVVKTHPLDPGLAPWARLVSESARGARAALLEGGAFEPLTPRLAGVVCVNSTAGLGALRAGVPTLAMGRAVWDAPGVSHQGGLDAFWRAPEPPDPARRDAMIRALTADTQLPGGFDGAAMEVGAANVAERILATDDARAAREAAP